MVSHARLGWSLRRVGYSETVHLPHDRDTVAVGRLSGDIICPGSTISRFHSRLVYSENTWNVVDLKSINGVHVKSVNGTSRRLAPNSLTPVNTGDFIIFGCENVKSEDRFVFELCRNLQNGSVSNNSSLAGTVVEPPSCPPETTVVEDVTVASLNFDNLDRTVSVRASCLQNEISSEDLKIPEETNVASKNSPSLAHSSLTSSTTDTFSVKRISLKSVIPNTKECHVVLEDIGPFLKNQQRISYKFFMEAKQKRGLQSIVKKNKSKRFKRILWTSDEESDSEAETVKVSSCINPSKRLKRFCLSEDNGREQPYPGPSWWTEDTMSNQTTKKKASSNIARQFGSNNKVDGISKYRKKYADGSRMRSQEKRLARERCASIGFDNSSPTNTSQSDVDDRVPSTSPHPQSSAELIDLTADELEQLIVQGRVTEPSSEDPPDRVHRVKSGPVKNTTSMEPSDQSDSNEDEDSKLARLCQTFRHKHRTTILTDAIPTDPEGRHRGRRDSSIGGDKAVENRDPNSFKKKVSSEIISRRLKVAPMFSQSYPNANMKVRSKGSRRRELQLKHFPSGYIASTKNAKAKVNYVNVPVPPQFTNLSTSKIGKDRLARDKVVKISFQTVVEKSAAPTKVKVTPKSRNCLFAEELEKEKLPVVPKKKRVLVEAAVFPADLQSKLVKKNKGHRKLKTPEVNQDHLTENLNEQDFPTETPSSIQEEQIVASMGQISKKKTSKRVSFSDKNEIRFFEPSREIYTPSESRESEVASKESDSEAIPPEMYSSAPKKRISLSEYRKSVPSRASSE